MSEIRVRTSPIKRAGKQAKEEEEKERERKGGNEEKIRTERGWKGGIVVLGGASYRTLDCQGSRCGGFIRCEGGKRGWWSLGYEKEGLEETPGLATKRRERTRGLVDRRSSRRTDGRTMQL